MAVRNTYGKLVDRENYVKEHGGFFKRARSGRDSGMWKWFEGESPTVVPEPVQEVVPEPEPVQEIVPEPEPVVVATVATTDTEGEVEEDEDI